MHRALKQVLRWGLVPRNACEAVNLPRPQKKEITQLEAASEAGDRLEALKRHHER